MISWLLLAGRAVGLPEYSNRIIRQHLLGTAAESASAP